MRPDAGGDECGAGPDDECGAEALDPAGDVGVVDVGAVDLGAVDLGAVDLGAVDLGAMDDAARLRFLVEQTARFSASFLRWVDARIGGGLTYPRMRLLEALHCGGPAIMRDLAGQLGMTARNMTAMVDALEVAGLARRRPHPSDRRATLVELTSTGLRAAETALEPGLRAVALVFDGLSDEEQQQFLQVLGRLSAAMGPARLTRSSL